MLKVKDELVAKLLEENQEFKKLYYEHMSLEQDLEALYSLKYFPPEVEKKIKEIKKRKLMLKDRMEQIASESN
jgi:uncharacterized protein YdcH (DUF465 family)